MQHPAGPQPLGLHMLIGPDAATKYASMVSAIAPNAITPIEIPSRKPATK